MRAVISRVARFLRLIDADHNISLTNLAVWISIVKLAMAPADTQPLDVVAFVGALASYQAKRHIGGAASSGQTSA